ncbi:P-loop containing nucleoside triphosphate hydrolase protein [Aulographum hederae CBS 113979]|uniref:RNA helicase n=1 Tax=Aulographum hederae CBS 113979 TaxID=1176131 RepID=A0A6G1H5F9_9PEZI|nr:P-loop containing nucleoside triphosphate hydrolase protein [Aulographum hederae CBS 113979]
MPERVHTSSGHGSPVLPSQIHKGQKRKRDHGRAPVAEPPSNPTPNSPVTTNSKATQASRNEDSHVPLKKSVSSAPEKQKFKNLSTLHSRNPPNKKSDKPPHKSSAKRDALLHFRKTLPIWPHAQQIRKSLSTKDVLLLVGETGSGKSTQIPQFLLSESWCTKCIAVTQPRRVAAISLARRVAEEMGSQLGMPWSTVGYSVRFDHCAGPSTRIKYLTEGMLLQEMLRDPELKQYSAVVVDEVHERSVNVDMIMGFLRALVTRDRGKRKANPLKVAVMSATADMEGLTKFFDDGYAALEKSEDDLENVKSRMEDETRTVSSSKAGQPQQQADDNKPFEESKHISTCFIEGRQYPVKIVYLPEPTLDIVEAALKSVFQIHYKEPLPGDILVFLTGQETVESLERLVNEFALSMGPEIPKILALPLFAALPQASQQKIFQRTPPKTRKVIISTNIAETSVTVPGVRYVVDSGKAKIKQFSNRLGLDSLLVKPISQSSATQRKGRAGREAAGQCYRLYTETSYTEMQKASTPEILRCDLSSAILTMKARGINDVVNFPFLDRPSMDAFAKALLQLYQLGTLNDDGGINETGRQLAKLPLTPMLGRIIVEAAKPERDCLVDVIDIIAALSVESIFLNLATEEKKERAEEARKELLRREGDHLTMLAAVRGYAAEQSDRRAWAEKYFVSHRAMQNVMNIRKQLRAQCKQLSLLPSTSLDDPTTSTSTSMSEDHTNAILQCILRGFPVNSARLMPDGSYKTLPGNQAVAIHPSSVLFGRKVEAIVFSEFVFTSKSYARGVSAVRLGWVDEVLGG